MKFDKVTIAITIQGILFCICAFCATYFGSKYFELKNKENVNILNLSGHKAVAKIKNNNVIELHHNSFDCEKCQNVIKKSIPRSVNESVRDGNGLESNIVSGN